MESLKKTGRYGCLLVVGLIPALFSRQATDAFDLVKGTALWIICSLLLPLWIVLRVNSRLRPSSLEWSTLAFVGAAVLSTAFSIEPLVSLWGQNQRYNGLLTLLSCCLLMILIPTVFNRNSLRQIAVALICGSSAVGVYAYLQETGADPFTWSISSFGKAVFGTMGNPNTASGMIAICLPIVTWAVFEAQDRKYMKALALMLWGLAVGTLPSLNSFQGSASAVVSSLLAVAYLIDNPSRRNLVLGIPMSVGSIAIPNLTQLSSGIFITLVVVMAGLLSVLSFSVRDAPVQQITKTNKRLLVGGSIISAAVGAVALWPTLTDGLAGGFVERGDFYRAAWAAFLDRPLLGSGIDTFGYVFPEFRPQGHALLLEGSRTSSVHSVHLGMFSNGGIFLGLAFLFLAVLTLGQLIRGLKRSDGGERRLLLGLGAAWVASHVQAVVSVEHVALLSTQFVLTGAIWSFSRDEFKRGKRSTKVSSKVSVVLAASLLASVLFSISVLSRPLRANISAREGLRAAYGRGDGDLALEKLSDAVNLSGWEPIYRLQRLEILLALGRTEEGAASALRILELSHNYPAYGVELCRIVASTGRYELAVSELEKTVAADPFAVGVKRQAAALYVEMGRALVENGEGERARDYFERALFHQPNDESAAEALSRLGL